MFLCHKFEDIFHIDKITIQCLNFNFEYFSFNLSYSTTIPFQFFRQLICYFVWSFCSFGRPSEQSDVFPGTISQGVDVRRPKPRTDQRSDRKSSRPVDRRAVGRQRGRRPSRLLDRVRRRRRGGQQSRLERVLEVQHVRVVRGEIFINLQYLFSSGRDSVIFDPF